MAFFKKLKDRLFNSSSKLEKGLDAIVDDGGEVDEKTPVIEDAQVTVVAATTDVTPEPEPEPELNQNLKSSRRLNLPQRPVSWAGSLDARPPSR